MGDFRGIFGGFAGDLREICRRFAGGILSAGLKPFLTYLCYPCPIAQTPTGEGARGMSKAKQKLELTWVGKDERPKLEPRILREVPELSYHADKRYGDDDIFDNILIQGDNLLALKALENDYRGKVKCIYIDPPYNTGQAFEHYDDGLEHSIWLGLLRDRLEILCQLLSDDGFICCQIDDHESAYLNVLLDEVFGRSNYLATFFVQVRYGNKTLAEDNDFQKVCEQCFIYAKDAKTASPNKLKEPYKVEKFEWEIEELSEGELLNLGGKEVILYKQGQYKIHKVKPSLDGLKETWATGSLVRQSGSSGEFLDKYLAPRKGEDGLSCLYKVKGIGEDGLGHRYMTGPKKADATKGKFYSGIPVKTLEKIKAGESDKELPIPNSYDFAAQFGNCRQEGGVEFRGGKKPEALLQKLIWHFSNEGDLILDSFGGSGTTAAVAHKMGRRWITIEIGDHAQTHIVPRLKRVIDGDDKSGVTKATGWKGGGGYRFYRLAPSLLEKDKYGRLVISKDYNPAMLSEAMCKLMGFTYAPSETDYWNHGYAHDQSHIYVTTNRLTFDYLNKLSHEVGASRSLLVCCKAFEGNSDNFINMTITKIPQAVLDKCEWGKDDYSLNVDNLPMAATDIVARQGNLFEENGGEHG